MESAIAGRRRTATRHSAEDQALDQIAKECSYPFVVQKQDWLLGDRQEQKPGKYECVN
ncbi:uncharacterized protein LOC112457909 isoform X2 [Temnothorax curvispinosus]|uniref:Uncharacterized protein LOC112457909 isoform X2 n=1 Tax=Temnothorax curvispinosus TaxID=300111 RepID=A0A6J1Q483_9HYME|nr:uncharacterized protein LOC112457909 isoform X2 [Temnothorax curvispinosus]